MKQIGRSELCKSDSLAELTSTVRALRPLGRHPAGDKAFGDVAARQIKMPEPAAQFAGRIEARDWLAAGTHDLLFGTIAAIQCTQTWRLQLGVWPDRYASRVSSSVLLIS